MCIEHLGILELFISLFVNGLICSTYKICMIYGLLRNITNFFELEKRTYIIGCIVEMTAKTMTSSFFKLSSISFLEAFRSSS